MGKPLTPAGLDLRNCSWLPLDVVALSNSDTWGLAEDIPGASRACINLWARAWHQVPAASLPNDEILLRKWADVPDWESVRNVALRGFVECSDGRLYHTVLAKKAIEAKEQREKAEEERETKRRRIAAWREKQKSKKHNKNNKTVTDTETTTKPPHNTHGNDHEMRLDLTRPDQTRPLSPQEREGDGMSGSREEQRDSAATLASPPEGGSLHGAEIPNFLNRNLNGKGMAKLLADNDVVAGSKLVSKSGHREAIYFVRGTIMKIGNTEIPDRVKVVRTVGVEGPWPEVVV